MQQMDSENTPQEETTLESSTDIVELLNAWATLSSNEHIEQFKSLPRTLAEELFLEISPRDQVEIYREIPEPERRSWIRMLAPDDAVDFIQELTEDERKNALSLFDPQTRTEVNALAAYAEDDAGGLMNPRYARLRPDIRVEEAIRYLRVQTQANVETIYYAYVMDQKQILKGVVSLRMLFKAPPDKRVDEIMVQGEDLITIPENMDQEEVGRIFAKVEMVALPVVDEFGVMKGIVTIDDIVRVVSEEATEDIQKIGGMEALDEPYLKIGILQLIKKRAGWLLALFIGEMATTAAMGKYEDDIAKAVVLALFLPLIISSGGNSGSQASTLIVRAMALGEVRLQDWWRVFVRETYTGVVLGAVLGFVGWLRIYAWPDAATRYGAQYGQIAMAVGISLVGIVLWGTIVGSLLPLLLKRLRLDPATASAPFVATLVDVTGIIIYFTVAKMLLAGALS
jgi:magnesium transporter